MGGLPLCFYNFASGLGALLLGVGAIIGGCQVQEGVNQITHIDAYLKTAEQRLQAADKRIMAISARNAESLIMHQSFRAGVDHQTVEKILEEEFINRGEYSPYLRAEMIPKIATEIVNSKTSAEREKIIQENLILPEN